MRAKRISDDGLKTFVLVFETGDEVMADLTAFAKREKLAGSHFTGIGAFSHAIIAFFDWDRRAYDPIEIREQVEVLSFAGDVSIEGDQPKVHAHVVLGKRDGTAHGGHLLSAHVRPTLEMTLEELPERLRRTYDSASMLPLIDLDDEKQIPAPPALIP